MEGGLGIVLSSGCSTETQERKGWRETPPPLIPPIPFFSRLPEEGRGCHLGQRMLCVCPFVPNSISRVPKSAPKMGGQRDAAGWGATSLAFHTRRAGHPFTPAPVRGRIAPPV